MPLVTATTARSGLRPVANGHRRHGQPGALAKAVHHRVELRRLGGPNHLCAVHPQDKFVREEIHHEIEEAAEDQGEDEALRSAQQLAGHDEQAQQAGHQYERLYVIHRCLPHRVCHPGFATNEKSETSSAYHW
jgi:hypothetical protein